MVLSYPVNMRPRGYTNVTGCFVNNVPLKLELDRYDCLDNLIAALTQQRKTVRDYQGYSLTDVITDQRRVNGPATHFFNVGITQANLNLLPLDLCDVHVEPIDITWNRNVIFEWGLLYDDYNYDCIKFKFDYRTELFDRSLVESFIDSFRSLLS